MGQLDLEICLSNLEYLIETKKSLIDSHKAVSEDYLELCDCYRNLGCGKFLLTLSQKEFYRQLSNSVSCYLMLLNTFDHNKFDPYYRCRSRGLSAIDAIAISDMQTLQKLDKLLSNEPVKQMEYEEDFYFIYLLTKMALGQFNQEQLDEELEQFSSLAGVEQTHVLLFDAINKGDAVLFEEAISELVGQWHDDIVKKQQNETIDPYFNLTAANVYVTGIAIIKIAQSRGINIEGKIRYVPSDLL